MVHAGASCESSADGSTWRARRLRYFAVLTEISSCQRRESSLASADKDEIPASPSLATASLTSCSAASDQRWFLCFWEDAAKLAACFRLSCKRRPLRVVKVWEHAMQTCIACVVDSFSPIGGVTVAGDGSRFTTFLQRA
ncbi:hypothetical protein T4A_10663 [Trichinella pseudospiralis]|uniref:Uncharacterized protein n=1 Tax=Trichinella pseudospiralis TaxID=6337 RepID=A0A0V1DU99_TRIPS|nr:hypothetical protein T4A_10663 [Trichinella pseudospiralis]